MVTKKPKQTASDSATINDVAKRAGVSIKTVSRVINGEPYVSEATATRVRAAAAELNYRPRLSARSLAGQRSREISIWHGLIDEGISTYYTKVQTNFVSACRNADFGAILDPLDPFSPHVVEQAMASLNERRPAGVVMTPPFSDNEALLAHLEERGIEFVRVSPTNEGNARSYAATDDLAGGLEMTDYLIGYGHRRIAFIGGPADHGAAARRLDGFLAAHRKHGLAVDEDLIVPGRFTFDSGAISARHLLSLSQRPTAIFAANDDMAVGVVHEAHRMDIRIPKDLSVAGFDDTPIARYIYPGISTVRQPISEMIDAAVQYLAARFRNENPTNAAPLAVRVPCSLVIRDSTGKPAGA